MADHCITCDTRRPAGGTRVLVLNGGTLWLEFCPRCESTPLTNPETGETLTALALYERSAAPVEVPFDEYGDLDAISCANGDYNAHEEACVFADHEGDDW